MLTDIENEPDDAQSMVRFLTYSNHWDVEKRITPTSVHQRNRVAPEWIRRVVQTYGKVRNNLLLHEKGYPETDYLLSRIKPAIPKYGMDALTFIHQTRPHAFVKTGQYFLHCDTIVCHL